jgi:hypothetical protein
MAMATRVYAPPVPGVWNAVSADDSNETVVGPTGGGSQEAGTPWRRTTDMFIMGGEDGATLGRSAPGTRSQRLGPGALRRCHTRHRAAFAIGGGRAVIA